MAENNSQYIRWTVPEYHTHERGRWWYIIAGLIILLCLFYSFFTISQWHIVWLGVKSNFLFALIIVVAAFIVLLNDGRTPDQVHVELGPEGVKIGHAFYDYDDLKNFSVLYKPKQSVKNLYFEHRNAIYPRLSVPLKDQDALTVRNFLLKYLDEDLDRVNPPLSEQLTKLLKL